MLRNIYYFFKSKVLPGFRVGRDSLVLDIGSGDKPFWRGDVFVDMVGSDDSQRHSGKLRRVDGTFVNADIHNLPFKDKSFDFSFCSHLLEHVHDPQKAIEEIMRVSKSGYIEVPNGLREFIRPFPTHLWMIFRKRNGIIFYRKSTKFFKDFSWNNSRYHYLMDRVSPRYINFYWKNQIRVEVDYINKGDVYNPENTEVNSKSAVVYSLYGIVFRFLRQFFYKRKEIVLENILKS